MNTGIGDVLDFFRRYPGLEGLGYRRKEIQGIPDPDICTLFTINKSNLIKIDYNHGKLKSFRATM